MMAVMAVVILIEDVGGEARVTGTLLDSWDARCGRLAWQGRPDWEQENVSLAAVNDICLWKLDQPPTDGAAIDGDVYS